MQQIQLYFLFCVKVTDPDLTVAWPQFVSGTLRKWVVCVTEKPRKMRYSYKLLTYLGPTGQQCISTSFVLLYEFPQSMRSGVHCKYIQ